MMMEANVQTDEDAYDNDDDWLVIITDGNEHGVGDKGDDDGNEEGDNQIIDNAEKGFDQPRHQKSRFSLPRSVDEQAGSDEVEHAEESQHHHHRNRISHLRVIFTEEIFAGVTKPCSGIVQMFQMLLLKVEVVENPRGDNSKPTETQSATQNSQECPDKIQSSNDENSSLKMATAE